LELSTRRFRTPAIHDKEFNLRERQASASNVLSTTIDHSDGTSGWARSRIPVMPSRHEPAECDGFAAARVFPTRSWLIAAAVALFTATTIIATETEAADQNDDPPEDVTKLAAFDVKADRLEDFGFRAHGFLGNPFGTGIITVSTVYPNTAAAKAGLQPGDRIVKSDGRSANFSLFSINKWEKFRRQKWAAVAAGKKNVTWVLEVQTPDTREPRTVTMMVPTPPPHWGSSKWQPPLGRAPAKVTETGPLADYSRIVLDNGVWIYFEGQALGLTDRQSRSVVNGGHPFRGYQWQLRAGDRVHTIFVSQERGRTDIVLQTFSRDTGHYEFLTSPSGALEKARFQPWRRRPRELELDEARAQFAAELDFWLTKVGKVSERWPLQVRPDAVAAGTFVAVAGDQNAPPPPKPASTKVASGKIALEVLKLALATEEQRTLFADAYAKIGADADHWAYTETSHNIDDKRVLVTRVDPSKPEAQRCTLLKVDGKPPTPADVQRWRDEGRDVPSTLGQLPPLGRIIDPKDLRVFADEPAAIVFELPLRSDNAEFPAEKFQALFRVNKAQRTFEDIRVKLREGFRIAGVVKITEAGIELRFQTLDPALAPQPVALKAGGAVRVLLVKVSRSFEAARADFQRVEPYVEPAGPSL
jgi:hypothetical protein